ncbi:MAG: AsmA-like C-terminal region-containing protein [Bacteroidales bacterium]
MWRISKILLFYSVLIILAITLAGILIAWYYQDRVKELMVVEVNRHIRTEVGVRDISFSVLRKFPQASVEFKEVVIKVPVDFEYTGMQHPGSDTLFTAESVFLQFKIGDLIRKKYRLTRLHAVNGVLNMAVNSHEEENYRFWRSSGTGNSDFNMDLQDLRITNYRISYINSIKRILIDTDIKRIEMKGNFNQESTLISGSLQGVSREFRHENMVFSGNREISIKAAANKSGSSFEIEHGTINISGVQLAVQGKYDTGDSGNIDLELRGRNIDIASAIAILGKEYQDNFESFRLSGMIQFEASLKGQYSKTHSPAINAIIYAENGEITRKETGMKFSGISLTGNFTNGNNRNLQSSKIVFSNITSSFGKGNINVEGSISNLSLPVIDIKVNGTFSLEEIAQFYKPDNILQIGGNITTSFSAKGSLQKPLKWEIAELNKMEITGDLEIESGLLQISGSKHVASGIGGLLHFGRTLRSENLSFNIGSDHFSINGRIENGLPWLLGNDQVMRINGNLFSQNLDIDNYINPTTGNHSRPEGSEHLIFPAHLELNLDFLIDDLRFRKFLSKKFKGKLSYKPRMMVLNEVEFNSMDGMVSGNGVIAQKLNGEFMLQSQLQMQNVDMQKMFLAFNNFGQKFIHGEHLRGSLKGNLSLISEWTPDLVLKRERIIADSKVEISNGELIAFEPMLGLARFISVSELNHIKFSTLKNEIFIRDQMVTIPQMDINSSAFNIAGSGTHHFDGNFDYRIKVLLSDVLYGKARTAKPENNKFGIVEDDGLGRTSLYLLVSGTTADYRVSYDHRTLRDVLKENIASERNTIRQLLNKEFGWFSSDSLNAVPAASAGGSKVIISWDEEEETRSIKSSEPTTSPQPAPVVPERKFRVIWDEEEKPDSERKK